MENREQVMEQVRKLSYLMVECVVLSNSPIFTKNERDSLYKDSLKYYELIGSALKGKDE